MNKLFGIVGIDLCHSFSQIYFEEKFKKEGIIDCEYRLFTLAGISLIPAFLERHSNLYGFNVTMPYKKNIMFFLDNIDTLAESIGAVNVVKVTEVGNRKEYTGHNTDVHGFRTSIVPLLKPHHTQALILGTGGAAQAVAFVLKKLGIDFHFVSRDRTIHNGYSYSKLSKNIIREHSLIINTTPIGMFPNDEEIVSIPYEYITDNHLLYDLIYNPEKTSFLKEGEKNGATIKNGLEMLHLQADKAWSIWNND